MRYEVSTYGLINHSLSTKKMLYSNYLIDKGILQIADIVDVNGKIMTYEDICQQYDVKDNK